MTFHRFMYKICWKNRIALPLSLLCCMLTLMGFLLRDTTVEFHPGGKIRFKYYIQATLSPPDLRSWQTGLQQDHVLQRKMAFEQADVLEVAEPWHGNDEVKLVRSMEHHVQIADEVNANSKLPPSKAKHQKEQFERNPTAKNSSRHAGQKDIFVIAGDRSASQDGNVLQNLRGADVNNDLSVRWTQRNKTESKRIKYNNIKKDKRKFKSRLKFKPVWKKTLYYNTSDPPEIFKSWRLYEEKFCDGKFIGYFNEFAMLRNVKLDRKFCLSERKGGEKIANVMNQAEEAEYLTYDVGCFQQKCTERPSYYFNNNNHMNDWLYSMKTHRVDDKSYDAIQSKFVIAIVRYEYVNIYHTMSDWYNAFLMMQFFNKTQWETNIILVDAHPQGSLDSTWLALFNTTRRISTLPNRTLFKNLVWNIVGYNSPLLDHYGPELPLVEEFREFFLTSLDIKDKHKLDCQEMTIMFIWRRDYLAHPRNPGGSISRKVENERELMKSVQEKYPDHHVRGIQIDIFDMQKQLNLVTTTDILIGMHGAGLTHALFLPKHAGLIELIPNYWSAANDHFYAISQWRQLWYERWINEDPHNEVHENFTKVPPGVLHALLKSVIKGMCY